MAKYFIYSTGTTYAGTIVRVSATDNPGTNEASYNDDLFIIPEIQPVYLWRVDNVTTPADIIPNTDGNIDAYLESITPAPSSDTLVTFGDLSGFTDNKIDKVTGATDNIPIFDVDGGLVDSGYSIPELTGLTTYTFIASGGTHITQVGNTVTISSTTPTGATVNWGDILGTVSNQTDLWADLQLLSGATTGNTAQIQENFALFTGFTATTEQDFIDVYDYIDYVSGVTDTKLDTTVFANYTGTTQPILDAALTGLTNLGTGTTLGGTSGRNVTIKSISGTGGISILGDADNLIISGQTSSAAVWGNITGTLSDQDDLWIVLTGMTAETATKLDIATFTGYTATTETRLEGIENDIQYISGITDTKLDIIAFTGYSATTETRLEGIEADIQYLSGITSGITAELDTKLDIAVFTGYTATTQPILDAALTGATNGLTAVGRNVELGGTLTKDTTISGTTFDLTVNTDNITLQSTGAIQLIDANGVGGITLESDGGTISLIGNDSVGVEKTKLEISNAQMLITDSRTTPAGLEYAADYSTTFTPESLVSKRYVDAIASGLVPKDAVMVATTAGDGDIDLTTGGLLTIDGYTVSDGDRVLVKNQTDATENGIYIASASTWVRSADFDRAPVYGEVTDGNLIPVLSGDTLYNTIWVLTTPNPITVGTTPLTFTLFSSQFKPIAGHGISITGNTIAVNGTDLDSTSIGYSGGTFFVNLMSGPVYEALLEKLDVVAFTGYSATTAQVIQGIENDIDYISGVTDANLALFTGYTATTQPILNAALTGATNGLNYANRVVQLGGDLTGNVTIDGQNTHDLFIANIDEFQVATDGITGATFGVDTQGITLIYSGTSVELTSNAGLEYIADYSANYTPRSLVDADYVTGITSTKLNISTFTGYTASTAANEIFLIHTGGVNLNTITPTLINWNSAPISGDAYQWTGGSVVRILEAGDYEINYNLPFIHSGGTSNVRSVGANIMLNGATVLNTTLAAATTVRLLTSGSLVLSTVVQTLAQNDILTLQTYRTGLAGILASVPNGSIMIKKKNKLQ